MTGRRQAMLPVQTAGDPENDRPGGEFSQKAARIEKDPTSGN